MSKQTRLGLLLVSLLGLFACDPNHRIDMAGGNKRQNIEPGTGFEKVQANIFPKCMPCHQADYAFGNIILSSYEEMMAVDPPVIIPGDPLQSRLYLSVQSGAMPQNSTTPLSPEELAVIYQWILDGAKP